MRKLYILPYLLALASPLSAKDLWLVPVHAEPVQMNLTWPVTQYALARFAFGIPDDMSSFGSARVVFLPTQTASGTYHLFLDVKRDGQTVSGSDIEAESDIPVSLSANEVTEVDVSSIFAGAFDATSAGNDQVSLLVYAPGALITSARVLGLRFTYDAVPIQTGQLANNAVNSAKVADNSLTGNDIANGTIGNADLADNSVNGAKILNGSVGNADLAAGAVTSDKILLGAIVGANISSQTINAIHLVDEAGVEFAGGTQTLGLGPVGVTVRSVDVTAPVAGFVTVQASGSFELTGDNAEARCGIRTDISPTVPSDATRAKLGTIAFGFPYLLVPFSVTDGFSITGGTTTTIRLVCDAPVFQATLLNSHLTATFSPTRY